MSIHMYFFISVIFILRYFLNIKIIRLGNTCFNFKIKMFSMKFLMIYHISRLAIGLGLFLSSAFLC
ncbi:hypothetical protein C4B60_12020 [Jeotgalibacillus proteolyticus]|uniref:Uncharacterized protein n=1 Tax=Jeotgalibacillus proteolyticus TaxID=2082395 RepID=A0A2S5GBD3_9BACL|nr:hypothetical protein C4B60_12020 [Jeotgalibacillus proteolyticus]